MNSEFLFNGDIFSFMLNNSLSIFCIDIKSKNMSGIRRDGVSYGVMQKLGDGDFQYIINNIKDKMRMDLGNNNNNQESILNIKFGEYIHEEKFKVIQREDGALIIEVMLIN